MHTCDYEFVCTTIGVFIRVYIYIHGTISYPSIYFLYIYIDINISYCACVKNLSNRWSFNSFFAVEVWTSLLKHMPESTSQSSLVSLT